MKFAIITHAVHKLSNKGIYAYDPYVREMNLWSKHISEIQIVGPESKEAVSSIESSYESKDIEFNKIPALHVKHPLGIIKAILATPFILFKIYKAMSWANHIHLRCPGNIGLLGCFVQILFPKKPKTVKYAGNWDPKSKQPLSYRLQKWILSNTTLTKNCKVLVYGHWPNQTKNIVPFFTASYSKKEIVEIPEKSINTDETIRLLFVGGFTKGKQPVTSVKVTESLIQKGYNVQLDMYGHGIEFEKVQNYISEKKLEKNITLHGNQSADVVKKAYQKAHFLVFISKSEGWPKVVAEAMFWGCIPITTNVSCVADMLGNESRGSLVNSNENEIVSAIESYLNSPETFTKKSKAGKEWSQRYTLESFEEAIAKFFCD